MDFYGSGRIVMGPTLAVKDGFGPWLTLLDTYEISTVSTDLMLRGILREDLDPSSPEVSDAVAAWSGPVHLRKGTDAVEVVLVLSGDPPPVRFWLHALLFAATIVTTLGAGALLAGLDPFRTRVLEWGALTVPYPTDMRWTVLAAGAPFAVPFLSVLLAHEMGHWVAARRHGIRASLPYFIPFPPYLSIIGTVGAFIRLQGATIRRSHLFDVGASGPLVSFVLSVPLVAVGLSLSEVVGGYATTVTPFVVDFAGTPIWLGNGLLLQGLTALFGPDAGGAAGPVLLHPVAFAGWLGLFVTALNLLPLGQLDGGHVLYALLGPRQDRVGRLFLLALLPLGLLWWGWWAWAALVAFLHRGRVGHPRVVQPEPPVGRGRTLLGWLVIAVFFLTFVPVPLRL